MALETLLRQTLLLILVLSGVPLAVSTTCGLIAALVQTATQVQEQSISLLVKLGAIAVLVATLGPAAWRHILFFIRSSLGALAIIGRG